MVVWNTGKGKGEAIKFIEQNKMFGSGSTVAV